MTTRYALVPTDLRNRPTRAAQTQEACDRIGRYLPSGYEVVGVAMTSDTRATVLVAGEDIAGWTMEDYVLPRLASGMYYGQELTADEAAEWQEATERWGV